MLLLALAASPAPLRAAPAPAPRPADGFWMKRYPLRSYGASWHLDVTVEDFAKARRAAERVIRREHGRSLIAPANQVGSDKVKYMQWSLVFSRADAAKALARLERLGKVTRAVEQEDLEPELPGEAAVKLARLDAELKAGGPLLDRLPAVRAAATEIDEHLRAATEAWKASQDKVLLDMTIEQAGR